MFVDHQSSKFHYLPPPSRPPSSFCDYRNMSLREYHRTLMKEAALSSSASSANNSSGGDRSSSASSTSPFSNGDVMNMRVEHVLVLRLEEKWEKVVAHITMVVLEQSRELVASLQIVLYAASTCLVLYGTAQLIKALRARTVAAPSSASFASSSSSSIATSKPNK